MINRTRIDAAAAIALTAVLTALATVLAGCGGGEKKAPTSEFSQPKPKAVSDRQIKAIRPAARMAKVRKTLGPPARIEDAGADAPRQKYFYYPVKGAERSRSWELTFRGDRLLDKSRCGEAATASHGGNGC